MIFGLHYHPKSQQIINSHLFSSIPFYFLPCLVNVSNTMDNTRETLNRILLDHNWEMNICWPEFTVGKKQDLDALLEVILEFNKQIEKQNNKTLEQYVTKRTQTINRRERLVKLAS